MGSITVGEFDAFYFSIQFLIFTILFSVGWLVGYGFGRSKYFTIGWSILLLVIQIVVVSKTTDIKADVIINAFAPVLAYAFYIIYSAELIRNMNEDESNFNWFILKRLAGFALILLILFLVIFNLFKSDFKAIEKEWGQSKSQQGKGDEKNEAMTKKDKDGFVSNKDQTKLSGSLNKDKQLVFVAKLDNFFEDGRTPNPLYFTSTYYTKFDTLTQTFEIDPKMPYNDLFEPDPSKIPLYFVKADSNIIKNTLSKKNTKVVNAEIYKVNLAASEYLAPSTAFYCQPISVPKEFKEQYRSAYRAKMWVSELNSAYFIYNPAGNRILERFQENRFQKLREIIKITGPDKQFMDYYTFMPKNDEYKKIGDLSKKITERSVAPIDKIIAIRDYFLSKDEFNQPLFKYSDNPGIPGMPSANKLTYFLLENKKGYCAYFAGATLFMLRSLGIPSRVVAGFSTTDRSNKNPGWYWFYQDQAHAWVQVYFQGYGWIDFDTTVPDINTRQAPQPDGTPPPNMPQTYLVADGEVESVNLITKQIQMAVSKLLYHDKDYSAKIKKYFTVDVSLASITTDTGEVKLNIVKKGMHITAVSYAEVLKNIVADKNDSLASIIDKLPKPTPVDEIKILAKDEFQKQKQKDLSKKKETINWMRILWFFLIAITSIVVLLFLGPWLIWQYFNFKAKRAGVSKAYHRYRAALYYLNQLGYNKSEMGPQKYAIYIDREFSTNLISFSNVYQKIKYSSSKLSGTEESIINEFYTSFIKQVQNKIPLKMRCSGFLNIYNTINYFSQPKIS